jgi:hypothetical protein
MALALTLTYALVSDPLKLHSYAVGSTPYDAVGSTPLLCRWL